MWEILLVTMIGAIIISGLGLLSVRADRMKRKQGIGINGGVILAENNASAPVVRSKDKPTGIMSMVSGNGQSNKEEDSLASVGSRPS